MKKYFLITTPLENTWRDDVPVLFLGEWCRRFSQKERWENIDAEVLPYHWDDRDRLHSDYQYLQVFYEQLLQDLTVQLNQIHGVEHSLRYWRILIGPWLGYFIQVLFDRWTSIHDAINKYEFSGTIIQVGQEETLVPYNMTHFMKLIVRDDWNHHIYANILTKSTGLHCETRVAQQTNKQSRVVNNTNWSKKIKESFLAFSDKILLSLTRDTDGFFLTTYLKRIDEIKLCLRINQVPRFLGKTPTVKVPFDSSERKWKLLGESQSEFESYIRALIPQQIPTAYLEGYKTLNEQAADMSWPKNPKVIWTSSSYNTDDIFKIYAAEKVEQGSPLVIGQHGGGIGTHLWAFYEEHQIFISDVYLSWGWTEISQPKIKPVGQLKCKYSLGVQHAEKNGIMLVTVKMPRYSYHIFSSPIASQWLAYFNDQCEFVETLIAPIRDVLTVRLKADDYGWDPIDRWKDRFPNVEVDEGNSNIVNLIENSRLYIATYNATTFLESFTMDIPTVMYWNPNHWELRDSAIPYFDDLKRVGILHETPISAAQHVNTIWEDVDAWWYSRDVQIALEIFKERYSSISREGVVDRVKYALDEAISTSKKSEKLL